MSRPGSGDSTSSTEAALAAALLDARDEPSAGELARATANILRRVVGAADERIDDRYTVGPQIGAGGLGRVHRAYDHKLERDVALKFLRTRKGVRPQLLLDEGKILARLQHPNIVTVYDTGVTGDEVYLAMELIDGVSIAAWLREAPRHWRDVVPLFAAAGAGLAAAHEAGVVHRDFKPANAMIDSRGRVRVVDFGLARAGGLPTEDGPTGDDGRYTGAAGTPSYMAPEQLDGRPEPASDQFSFCTALVEALGLESPWAATGPRGLSSGRDDAALDARLAGVGAPRWLRRTILRGLQRAPASRFASMDALLAGLRPPRRVMPAVAVASGLAVALWLGTDRSDPCTDRGVAATQRWTDERAGDLRSRLELEGADAQPVIARLSEYADEWNAMDAEACRDHAEQRLSSALYELRTRCLRRSLDGVEYLLDELSRAPPATLAQAVAAARSGTDLEPCRDDEGLLVGQPETGYDAELGDRIQRGIDRAHLHQVLGDTGRFVEDLLALREAIDPPGRAVPDELWLAVHLGTGLSMRGRHDEAEALLAPALMQSEGHARWALQTGALRAQLAVAIAADPTRAGEARILARQAVPLLESLHDDGRFLTLALAALANAAMNLGDGEEALAAANRAVALAEDQGTETWSASRLNFAQALAVLGDVQADGGEPDPAASSYERSLAILSAGGYVGETRANVANNLGLLVRTRGERERALALFGEAAGIKQALGLVASAAASYMNVANTKASAGDVPGALDAFARALELAPEGTQIRAELLLNRAIMHQRAGMLDEAASDYASARQASTGLEGTHEPLAYTAAIGLGQVVLAQGRPSAAASILEEARAVETASCSNYSRAELRLALSQARALTDPELARQLALAAESYAQQAGNDALLQSARARVASLE